MPNQSNLNQALTHPRGISPTRQTQFGKELLLACLFLLLISLTSGRPQAGEGLTAFGLRLQSELDLAEGNDFFYGPELLYSNYWLCNHKLQLRLAYLTNRPEAALRTGAVIKQDFYLFTPTWHFRRNRFFDPTLEGDFGYTWFDNEGLRIDNDTWLLTPALGLNLNFSQGQLGLYGRLGVNIFTGSGVWPATLNFGFWNMF